MLALLYNAVLTLSSENTLQLILGATVHTYNTVTGGTQCSFLIGHKREQRLLQHYLFCPILCIVFLVCNH